MLILMYRFEKVLKEHKTSVWLRNMQLSLFTLPFGLITMGRLSFMTITSTPFLSINSRFVSINSLIFTIVSTCISYCGWKGNSPSRCISRLYFLDHHYCFPSSFRRTLNSDCCQACRQHCQGICHVYIYCFFIYIEHVFVWIQSIDYIFDWRTIGHC